MTAKQDFFSRTGVFSLYDEKVDNQTGLYGLTTWKVPVAAQPLPGFDTFDTVPDPSTGLESAPITFDVDFDDVESASAAGTYYVVTGGEITQPTGFFDEIDDVDLLAVANQPTRPGDQPRPGARRRGSWSRVGVVESILATDIHDVDPLLVKMITDNFNELETNPQEYAFPHQPIHVSVIWTTRQR